MTHDFVVDADSHLMEPPDLWTARLPLDRWGEAVPHVQRDERTGIDRWVIGTRRASPVAQFAHSGWTEFPPSYPPRYEDVDPGAWDRDARLARLAVDGIDRQILYPNLLGFFGHFFLTIEPELRLKVTEAYNDYLLDFCAGTDRFVPLASVPFWDADVAVREIERCERLGHRGIIFPSNFEPVGLPAIYEEHWHPVFDAAQHLDLSVNFHSGFLPDEAGPRIFGRGVSRAAYAKNSAMLMLGNARTVADITLFGVCDRFPSLKFVSVESGTGWFSYLAELLDWQWLASGARDAYPESRRMPSECMHEQVFGTFWFERMADSALAFPDNFLFSTDYPHPTSLTPGPASYAPSPSQAIAANLAPLPDDVRQKLLSRNAAKVYHLSLPLASPA